VPVRVAEGSRLEIDAASHPQGWAIASYLVGRAPGLGLTHVGYDGRDWAVGSNAGWRRGGAAGAGSVVVG
jgi:hypothetical protein